MELQSWIRLFDEAMSLSRFINTAGYYDSDSRISFELDSARFGSIQLISSQFGTAHSTSTITLITGK